MPTLCAAVVMALISVQALAGDWQPPDGAEINDALRSRVLAWPGGQTQNFLADGRTLYESDRAQWRQWRVEGERYCSVWPPSDRWNCTGVERHARGLDLRFVADGGTVTEARYVDLQ